MFALFSFSSKMTVTEESLDGREIFFTYNSGETLVPVNLPWYQENRYVENTP
jgi:hypothetical protein